MHAVSRGSFFQLSSPSKCSMGTCAIGSGSLKRRLTAMRRRPSASSWSASQCTTQPRLGQKWNPR